MALGPTDRITRRIVAWVPCVLLGCLACALYGRAFGDTPAYLGGDEAHFAIHANAIASTGHDLNGQFMPLFFNVTDPLLQNTSSVRWYQPMLFYLTALVLRFLPLSEASIRLPTAIVGVLDVMLVYPVANRLFKSKWYATLGSLLLLLTPAHLIFSRQGLDYICLLPITLGWLWCLMAAVDTDRPSLALACGLLLGLGVYSYIAAWILMPCFLLLTWITLYLSARRAVLSSALAGVGFALPLLALIPWLWAHPDMLRENLGRYGVYDTRHLSMLQGAKDFLNYNNVQERLSVYWDYFNPAFLFFTGGSNLTTGTRRAGVFLMPMAAFLVCGGYAVAKRGLTTTAVILFAGFALAVVPATLIDERYAIQRALLLLPFGVLIGTCGVRLLLEQPNRTVRLAAILLLIAMPFQYVYFYRDYFTGYRTRSAFWFDPIDFRDVAEFLMSSDANGNVPTVYLSEDLDDVGARWRFYTLKHAKEELWRRTRYLPAAIDSSGVAAGSLIVLYANDARLPTLVGSHSYSVARTIVDVAGSASAVILRKES